MHYARPKTYYADFIAIIQQMPNLHQAAKEGDIATITSLSSQGEDVNALDALGWAPLHIATDCEQVAAAELLLRLNADPDSKQRDSGRSALHLASQRGHSSIVNLLITNGADVNIVDEAGWTPLHDVAVVYYEESSESIIEALLVGGADLHIPCCTGCTPLQLAASENRLAPVETLVNFGADMNLMDSRNPKANPSFSVTQTALQAACEVNGVEAAEHLINFGADVNAFDLNGSTPLHLAAKHDDAEVLRLLLREGADASTLNRKGETATQVASIYKYVWS
eukprot:GILJ01026813.1.p1 GENE.GILJ01026813.1~~GILJ01026813.1.p1  ORF type:complete len:281 (+),score=26.44 GILJ01026813.1:350-1192(+)